MCTLRETSILDVTDPNQFTNSRVTWRSMRCRQVGWKFSCPGEGFDTFIKRAAAFGSPRWSSIIDATKTPQSDWQRLAHNVKGGPVDGSNIEG